MGHHKRLSPTSGADIEFKEAHRDGFIEHFSNRKILPEFLSVAEFCALMDVNSTTLWRWTKQGLSPPRIVVGKTVRFERKAVEKWIAQRTRNGL